MFPSLIKNYFCEPFFFWIKNLKKLLKKEVKNELESSFRWKQKN